jgi:hypothetical protein
MYSSLLIFRGGWMEMLWLEFFKNALIIRAYAWFISRLC